MAFTAEARRKKLWFGTEQAMRWMPTPNRGADVSPEGWGDGGTLLNGGGYQLNSFGSHKNYLFEWPSSSARRVAQLMKSYADGTYGRGLIYFLDPLTYDTNVLPARWADPSMSIGVEGASLVYGVDPDPLPTSNWQVNDLPVRTAYYDLGGISAGWRGKEEAVFIPRPEGHSLSIGAFYSRTGSGGVFYRVQSEGGGLGPEIRVSELPANSPYVGVNSANTGAGIWIWVGKSSVGASSASLSALSVRVYDTVNPLPTINDGPWIGGQGHSGVRFVGKPTYMNNTGVNGGQVSYAATFKEVGSWIYG